VQARHAFATYLMCIQHRLVTETRNEADTDPDTANEQMVCIISVSVQYCYVKVIIIHVRDFLAGSTDDSLQQALVYFLNLMLAGAFDQEISSIIFWGRLIALSKIDGGFQQQLSQRLSV